MAELRGTGNSPRRWLLDRTTLTVQTPTERTLVPLDQIVEIHVGHHSKSNAPLVPMALGVLLVVAGGLWFMLRGLTLPGTGLIGGGVVLLIAGLALKLTGGSKGVTVHTHDAPHELKHPLDAELDDFVDQLVDARNAYLEGIDTVE